MSNVSHLQYEISPLEPGEINFFLSSFKRSYREACPNVRTDAYFLSQGVICDEILARFPTILAARNADGVILGWICCEVSPKNELVVHFTYVKSPYRRQGISKALLSAALDAHPEADSGFVFTHRTRMAFVFERLGFQFTSVGQYFRSVRNPK